LKDKTIIPIEVKMNYIKKSTKNLLYFMDKYKIDKGFFMVFNKDLKNEVTNIAQIYPWELFNMAK
jgi:diadenosine tetraphosphate (Ap4A) HIT family hydrolase